MVTRKEFLEHTDKELEVILVKRLSLKKMHDAAITI